MHHSNHETPSYVQRGQPTRRLHDSVLPLLSISVYGAWGGGKCDCIVFGAVRQNNALLETRCIWNTDSLRDTKGGGDARQTVSSQSNNISYAGHSWLRTWHTSSFTKLLFISLFPPAHPNCWHTHCRRLPSSPFPTSPNIFSAHFRSDGWSVCVNLKWEEDEVSSTRSFLFLHLQPKIP